MNAARKMAQTDLLTLLEQAQQPPSAQN